MSRPIVLAVVAAVICAVPAWAQRVDTVHDPSPKMCQENFRPGVTLTV